TGARCRAFSKPPAAGHPPPPECLRSLPQLRAGGEWRGRPNRALAGRIGSVPRRPPASAWAKLLAPGANRENRAVGSFTLSPFLCLDYNPTLQRIRGGK